MSPYHSLDTGTRFLRSSADLAIRLHHVRAVLFDWDGVFNDGWKDIDGGSPFSEVGSMGVNLLRFSLWLKNGTIPPAAVLTGQINPHAEKFVKRERFHAIYMGFINKPDAFKQFLADNGLKPEQVAFFFDDAIDLPVAKQCGLRVMIGRNTGKLFTEHVVARGDVDIITEHSGGENGLREATEAVMGLMGSLEEVIDHRAGYSEQYQHYLRGRNATALNVQRGSH